MNIFILSEDPVEAAQMQCDKHVVKMIVESAQMLSTAHRILDGKFELRPSKSGKRQVKYWKMDGSKENTFYKPVHMNHPCTVWARQNNENYIWLYVHFIELCHEYQYRYKKDHSTYIKLAEVLGELPENIPKGSLTSFAFAMKHRASCLVEGNPVQSYRNYYVSKQNDFKMKWSKRPIPDWFKNAA